MKIMVTTLALAAGIIVLAAGVPSAGATKRPLNACGCYGEGNNCICERKAKCGCPGECEPKGCEAARQKQLQKEIEAETKKAKEAEEKANASAEGKDKAAEEAEKAAEKKPAVKPMSVAAKKQFKKLLEAYLAEHPEAQNKMLSEVRAELQ
jgi:hypothetical protein